MNMVQAVLAQKASVLTVRVALVGAPPIPVHPAELRRNAQVHANARKRPASTALQISTPGIPSIEPHLKAIMVGDWGQQT